MRWNGCRAASASASARSRTTINRSRKSTAASGAAINLAGVRHEDVIRGQEIAAPGYLVPSRVLTVRLHCLADAKRPIKHRLPVRFHLGTAEVMGVVALLDCDAVDAGPVGPGPAVPRRAGDGDVGPAVRGARVVGGADAGRRPGLAAGRRKVRRRHLEMLERDRAALDRRRRGARAGRSPGSAASAASRRPTWCAAPASGRTRRPD